MMVRSALIGLLFLTACDLGSPLPDTSDTGEESTGSGDFEESETGETESDETSSVEPETGDIEVDGSSESDGGDESGSTSDSGSEGEECSWREAKICQILLDAELEETLADCDARVLTQCPSLCVLRAKLEHWEAVDDCYACATRRGDEDAECDYEQWATELDCLDPGQCGSEECATEGKWAARRCRSKLDLG